jgi:hypothetical protein
MIYEYISVMATPSFAVHSTSKVREVTSGPPQTNFTLSVSPLVVARVVTPKLTYPHAAVSINGAPAADGMPFDPIRPVNLVPVLQLIMR